MNTAPIRLISALALVAFQCSSALAAPDAPVPAYFAKVTVEVTPLDSSAEQRLRAHLPKDDPSVTIAAVRNTGLFEIGVTASEPKLAAKRANEIAVTIQGALGSEAKPKLLKIWERAEPPIAPLPPKKTE